MTFSRKLSDARDGRVASRRHNSGSDFPAVPSEAQPTDPRDAAVASTYRGATPRFRQSNHSNQVSKRSMDRELLRKAAQ